MGFVVGLFMLTNDILLVTLEFRNFCRRACENSFILAGSPDLALKKLHFVGQKVPLDANKDTKVAFTLRSAIVL